MRIQATLVSTLFAVLLGVTSGGCGPEYPNCDQDDDCHEGEFCVNGQCQDCRTNADCPAGQSCESGACSAIEGYCDAQTPCPSGQECVDNRCRAPQSTDACAAVTCPTGNHCENGTCVADAAAQSCALESVYFEYDSDAIDESDRRTLQTDARCIAELRPNGVHATGYADNRGTEEYNFALSERRAQQVVRYLRSLGVTPEITSSGMGEEMAEGSDEASWVRDRRVELRTRP